MIALVASSQLDHVTGVVNTIDWSHPTWDLFLALIVPVAAVLYGLALGRDRVIVILVSIYMSLAVVAHLPNRIVLSSFAFQASAFVGLFLILFFLLSRSALHKTIATSDNRGPLWQTFLLSILQVGLLISVVLSFMPDSSIQNLQPMTRHIFVDPAAAFLWLIAPIFAMFALRGKDKDKKFKYDV